MITAGVDIGSTTCKTVLLKDNEILGDIVILSGVFPAKSAKESFERCCADTKINKADISVVASTGYGRRLANFGDMVITEIKACALGTVFLEKLSNDTAEISSTIIDVGGQDTKVISLNENSSIDDFAMNDKCAAGTGRFLEMLAKKLEMDYVAFTESALESGTSIHMNSTCAVFAESEVVSLLAKGIGKADIACAAHNAIADRICSMVRRVGLKKRFILPEGGAKNMALRKAIEEGLNRDIFIPDHPQTIVALGAAIAARDRLLKKDINDL